MGNPAAREKSYRSGTKLELRGQTPERKLPVVEKLRQLLDAVRADNSRLLFQVEQAEAEVWGSAHGIEAFDVELNTARPGREWEALQRFDNSYVNAESAQRLPVLKEPAVSATAEDRADYRRALIEQYCATTFLRDDQGVYTTAAEVPRKTAVTELIQRICPGVKPDQVDAVVRGIEHKIKLFQRDSTLADAASSFSRGGMEIIIDTLARSNLALEHPTHPLTDRTVVAELEAMATKKAAFLLEHPTAEANYNRIKRVALFEGNIPVRPKSENIKAAVDSLLERFARFANAPDLARREIDAVLIDLREIFRIETSGGYYTGKPELFDVAYDAYPGYRYQDYSALGQQLCERLSAIANDGGHYDVNDFKTPDQLYNEARSRTTPAAVEADREKYITAEVDDLIEYLGDLTEPDVATRVTELVDNFTEIQRRDAQSPGWRSHQDDRFYENVAMYLSHTPAEIIGITQQLIERLQQLGFEV